MKRGPGDPFELRRSSRRRGDDLEPQTRRRLHHTDTDWRGCAYADPVKPVSVHVRMYKRLERKVLNGERIRPVEALVFIASERFDRNRGWRR